jgi:hypothetical protein
MCVLLMRRVCTVRLVERQERPETWPLRFSNLPLRESLPGPGPWTTL